MRRTFVIDPRTRKLIPKEEAFWLHGNGNTNVPNIIGDMAETKSLLDGKVYSSKRHYRDHLRAHDAVIVGNDFNNQPMTGPKPDVPDLTGDIKRAMDG